MTDGRGDALVIDGARKAFGPTQALDGVSLALARGEVHALVGENGAGKSTLLKILVGAERLDAGSVLLDGAPYAPRTPAEATRAGVVMVHQERSLCPHLTVEENVLLGVEPTRALGVIDRGEQRRRAIAALREAAGDEASIAPDAIVGRLSPGDQQLVEIARAMARAALGRRAGDAADAAPCRVLILDEPTSSLGRGDVERLFARVRALAARGTSVLYVSHFLEEIAALADRYTVIRDGKSVASGAIAGTTPDDLVRAMTGRAIDRLFPRTARAARGEPLLRLDRVVGIDKPIEASLALHRGEVLGLAGLVGAGRTELLRAIFGLDPVRAGEVRVKGIVGGASPAARLAQGVGLLSEDRKGEGLAGRLSIADNVTLSKLPRGLRLPAQQEAIAARWIGALSIKCRDPGQRVEDLSGGNQQKVALARLLHHGVDVLLLDEPTRGIDVGSKAQIYALVDRLAAEGAAVLLVSSYLPELLGTCDRIAVMRRGRLDEARPVADWTEHALLARVTGAA